MCKEIFSGAGREGIVPKYLLYLLALYLELKGLSELIGLRQDQCRLDPLQNLPICTQCQTGFLRGAGRRPARACALWIELCLEKRIGSRHSSAQLSSATTGSGWSRACLGWRALNRAEWVAEPPARSGTGSPPWSQGSDGDHVYSPLLPAWWMSATPGPANTSHW